MVLLTPGGLVPHLWGTKTDRCKPKREGLEWEAGDSIPWACANRWGSPIVKSLSGGRRWDWLLGVPEGRATRYVGVTGAQPLDCSEDEPAASLRHCAKRRLSREWTARDGGMQGRVGNHVAEMGQAGF